MSIFLLIIAALAQALGIYATQGYVSLAKEEYEASKRIQQSMHPYHNCFILLRNFQLVGLTLMLIYLATQYLRLA